jgi:hypothetical protein
VPAFTISRRIIRRDISHTLLRTVRVDVGTGLVPGGALGWAVERAETFSGKEVLLPFSKTDDARYIVIGGREEEAGRNMDKAGARCQVFYGEVEEVLEGREWKWRGLGLNRSRGGSGSGEDSPGGGGER